MGILREFFTDEEAISVTLVQGKRSIAHVSIPLGTFAMHSGYRDNKEYQLQFHCSNADSAFKECSLKVAIGLERGGTACTELVPVQKWHNLFLPRPDFCTSDPLPEEWFNLLPDIPRVRANRSRRSVVAPKELDDSSIASKQTDGPAGIPEDLHTVAAACNTSSEKRHFIGFLRQRGDPVETVRYFERTWSLPPSDRDLDPVAILANVAQPAAAVEPAQEDYYADDGFEPDPRHAQPPPAAEPPAPAPSQALSQVSKRAGKARKGPRKLFVQSSRKKLYKLSIQVKDISGVEERPTLLVFNVFGQEIDFSTVGDGEWGPAHEGIHDIFMEGSIIDLRKFLFVAPSQQFYLYLGAKVTAEMRARMSTYELGKATAKLAMSGVCKLDYFHLCGHGEGEMTSILRFRQLEGSEEAPAAKVTKEMKLHVYLRIYSVKRSELARLSLGPGIEAGSGILRRPPVANAPAEDPVLASFNTTSMSAIANDGASETSSWRDDEPPACYIGQRRKAVASVGRGLRSGSGGSIGRAHLGSSQIIALDDLAFECGDRITVVGEPDDSGWVLGECRGARGRFPLAFTVDPKSAKPQHSLQGPGGSKIKPPPESDQQLRNKLVCKKLADANLSLGTSVVAIHHAVRNGDVEEVKRILDEDRKGLLNQRDTFGRTPLLEAVRSRQFEVARFLLERRDKRQHRGRDVWDVRCDVNCADLQGFTALHLAAALGVEDLVNMMLAADCQRDLLSAQGQSAADLARLRGNDYIAQLLEAS